MSRLLSELGPQAPQGWLVAPRGVLFVVGVVGDWGLPGNPAGRPRIVVNSGCPRSSHGSRSSPARGYQIPPWLQPQLRQVDVGVGRHTDQIELVGHPGETSRAAGGNLWRSRRCTSENTAAPYTSASWTVVVTTPAELNRASIAPPDTSPVSRLRATWADAPGAVVVPLGLLDRPDQLGTSSAVLMAK